MEKHIPLLILTLGLLSLQSCREQDFFETEATKENLKTSSEVNRRKDSTSLNTEFNDPILSLIVNDPDPPVKDGQDWKM